MDRPDNKSSQSKTMWIVVGAVIALIVLGASVYAVFTATMPKKETTTNNTTTQTEEQTKEKLRASNERLDKAIKQDKIDREGIQEALNDQLKRIKLSN